MGGCAEYVTLVVLQHLEPALNIGGMIGTRLRRQCQIRTQECCTQFGHKLFARATFIAPFLSTEFATKACLVSGPVDQFMRQRRIIGFRAPEAFETRHLHVIARITVIGLTATMADIGARCGKESISKSNPLERFSHRLRLQVVVLWQPLDLLNFEDSVGFEKPASPSDGSARPRCLARR